MKCTVVSGAAAGIGAATAKHLADNGNRVIGVDLTGDVAVRGDVSDGGVDALVQRLHGHRRPAGPHQPCRVGPPARVNLGGA